MNKFLLVLTTLFMGTAFAAGGGTGTVVDLIYPAINFVILFGTLGFILRKPVKEMFDKNAEEVKSLYSHAEEKDKEAQIKLAEYKKKIENLESEKQKILKEAEENASKFSKEHAKETDQLISTLEADAVNRAENEKMQMNRQLNSSLLDEVINKVKSKVEGDKGLQEKATKKLVSQI